MSMCSLLIGNDVSNTAEQRMPVDSTLRIAFPVNSLFWKEMILFNVALITLSNIALTSNFIY